MPHQCIRCSKVFPDGTKSLLEGCASCGSKFFFFIKEEEVKTAEQEIEKLTFKEREKIEKDVMELIGERDEDSPVILDFESIRTLKPGKFEIDIRHLFEREPLVYKMADGKYAIDLASTFQLRKKK